ncbi:ABC transporter permease [Macrococcus animalis]|uniref:ABC transporter permease n=1 Tax=Macrococcus animalis TaxID=3395467 RepID=UPI0039BDBE84
MKNLLIKSLTKNKIVNLSLGALILASSMAAGLSIMLMSETFQSIHHFHDKAQPPHFLQMHKGELSESKVNRWMSLQQNVTYHQNVRTIAIDGTDILFGKPVQSMRDTQIDLSLTRQNPKKDLLLDKKHNVVRLKANEIGIPILLKNKYKINIGDTIYLKVENKLEHFKVKTFVLDSMMNSEMVSSTRILLSDDKFDALVGKIGEVEFIVEAYFKDPKESNQFQTNYAASDMPKGGPAITHQMIFLISSISDLLLVFITGMMSLLMFIVALVSMRFAILGNLEEDVKMIGTLKAIGFNNKAIRKQYLNKYRVICGIAIILSMLLSRALLPILMTHISDTFGRQPTRISTLGILLVTSVLIYFMIIIFVRKLLKRINRLTIVDALVTEKGFGKKSNYKLKTSIFTSNNVLLSLARNGLDRYKKSWMVIFILSLVTTMMVALPFSLYNTLKDKDFITYMGHPKDDIIIEISDGVNAQKYYRQVLKALPKIDAIKSFQQSEIVRVETKNKDKDVYSLDVESSKTPGIGLKYLNGNAPENDGEIAISYLNAKELEKSVGDKIMIMDNDDTVILKIVGIYQDVTGGGFSSKTSYQFKSAASKFGFSIFAKDVDEVNSIVDVLQEKFPNGVTISPMEDLINQTLGSIAKQVGNVTLATTMIALGMYTLISSLFLRLRMTEQSRETSILKALGFKYQSIFKIWSLQSVFTVSLGIIGGLLAVHFFGRLLISLLLQFAGLGIKSIQLVPNIYVQFLMLPIVMVLLILIVTRILLVKERKLI